MSASHTISAPNPKPSHEQSINETCNTGIETHDLKF